MLSRHTPRIAEIIVVGGGIVGAFCARELADRGLDVCVLDAGWPGATGAGMGHLVNIDSSEHELALCAYSTRQWHQLGKHLPETCAYTSTGTLWLAESDADRKEAENKSRMLATYGIKNRWLDKKQLQQAEPLLRKDLVGGLEVPGDAIVYAPAVANWLLNNGQKTIVHQRGKVVAVDANRVQLDNGHWLAGDCIVLANGLGAAKLLPATGLFAKKGQLAITDRYPKVIHHQLVELAYTRQAHATGDSVTFNVQPRPTGQLLIGSSRQLHNEQTTIDMPLLRKMLCRARYFLPDIATMTLIRSWTGFRPSTHDDMPLIGPWEAIPGLWLALGHEGHGVTTAPVTATLLADQIMGCTSKLDPTPYLPSRMEVSS